MMKTSKLTKVIASSLIVASVLALNPIGASASTKWKQDNTGWWYTEGSSYATGWKEIDGAWYYFYSDGYAASGWQKLDGNWYYFNKSNYSGGEMQHDTIINGSYLNSSGVWSNETAEMQKYAELLNDTSWQKENGIQGGIDYNIIIDLDQDGVYEMLLHHGTCMANLTISVVTYNNGSIKIDHVNTSHGGYCGYIKDEKVFCTSGGTQGATWGQGYKLENGKCKQVYSWSSNWIGDMQFGNCKLNEQSVSETEYKQFLDKIDRYYGSY